jgi:uncharacterized protein (TIGR03086 family)
MDTTSMQFESARRPLTEVVAAVAPDAWANPSPCEGWSARDVLGHLITTQREFLTGHGVDLGPAPDLTADPAGAWRDHAQRVATALADDALTATPYDGHFGPTTIGATFAQFYVWDMLVHRWDIARAVGADAGLSADELDRIEAGAESFGEALHMEGICRPGLDVPPDAARPTRVLARLGRAA